MSIEMLIRDIKAISNKYDSINQKTGGYFNIFEIANIATDEVNICRVIYELLSPQGSHYQGNTYLKLFILMVLKIDMSAEELATAKVYREYVINLKRRIDLVIQTKDRFIPIEVKIYAGDQDNQCFDYYQKAMGSKIYYLTRYGSMPSECSANGLAVTMEGYEEVAPISFSTDVIDWLDVCLKQKETIKLAPIREIILQLSAAIHKFTNQMEDEMETDVMNKILESSETLKYALDIEKSLPKTKSQIMKNFLDAVKIEFESKGKKVIGYNQKDVDDFYQPNVRTYPCVSIPIKEFSSELTAMFNIEIGDNLYYYFGFQDEKGKNIETSGVQAQYKSEYDLFVKKVKTVMAFDGKITKNTFFWEYINNQNNENYNFKLFSQPCINLMDKNKLEAQRICRIYDEILTQIIAEMH